MTSRSRVVADCRKLPSKKRCTLTIAGKMSEVLPIAVYHAVKNHGHKNTPKLHREIKKMIKKA